MFHVYASYMSKPRQTEYRRWICAFGAAILLMGTAGLSVGHAQQAPIIPVADVTLTPLGNGSIADVKGTGLPGPDFDKPAGMAGTIVLWDEFKPLPQEQNILDGVSTVTLNGMPQ